MSFTGAIKNLKKDLLLCKSEVLSSSSHSNKERSVSKALKWKDVADAKTFYTKVLIQKGGNFRH